MEDFLFLIGSLSLLSLSTVDKLRRFEFLELLIDVLLILRLMDVFLGEFLALLPTVSLFLKGDFEF